MMDNKGQSLLEVIVALGIFFTAIAGSLSATSYYLDNYQRSKDLSKIKDISQESFAAVRSIGYNSWGNMSTGTYGITTSSGKWNLKSSTDKIDNKYRRKVIISSVERENKDSCETTGSGGNFIDPEIKFVTTTISWGTPAGTTTRSFGGYISNWDNPKVYEPQSKNGVLFTKNGRLKTLASEDSKIKEWDPSNIKVIGPMRADFDDDGNNDIVYLKNKNKIQVVDDSGERDISISKNKAKNKKTILSVANWNGSGTSTFYISTNKDGNRIFYVDENENPTLVANPDNGTDSLVGSGDIDYDDTNEFIFVDGSQALRYIEPSDSTAQTFSKAFDNVGSNNNTSGVGEPADFDGDTKITVPIVNGSNELVLVNSSGKVTELISDEVDDYEKEVAKSPIAPIDIDGDCLIEIAFIPNEDSDKVVYVDDVKGSNNVKTLTDKGGNTFSVDLKRGVMPANTTN